MKTTLLASMFTFLLLGLTGCGEKNSPTVRENVQNLESKTEVHRKRIPADSSRSGLKTDN